MHTTPAIRAVSLRANAKHYGRCAYAPRDNLRGKLKHHGQASRLASLGPSDRPPIFSPGDDSMTERADSPREENLSLFI